MATSLVPLTQAEMHELQGSMVDRMIELNRTLHNDKVDRRATMRQISSLSRLHKKMMNYQTSIV